MRNLSPDEILALSTLLKARLMDWQSLKHYTVP